MSGEKRKERMNLYRFWCLFCRRLKYISIDFSLSRLSQKRSILIFQSRTAEVSNRSKERMGKNGVIQVKDGQTEEDG